MWCIYKLHENKHSAIFGDFNFLKGRFIMYGSEDKCFGAGEAQG